MFKIGDKVRIINDEHYCYTRNGSYGTVITNPNPYFKDRIFVLFDFINNPLERKPGPNLDFFIDPIHLELMEKESHLPDWF